VGRVRKPILNGGESEKPLPCGGVWGGWWLCCFFGGISKFSQVQGIMGWVSSARQNLRERVPRPKESNNMDQGDSWVEDPDRLTFKKGRSRISPENQLYVGNHMRRVKVSLVL